MAERHILPRDALAEVGSLSRNLKLVRIPEGRVVRGEAAAIREALKQGNPANWELSRE